MMNDPHQKVQASHLKRNAYVSVRQSGPSSIRVESNTHNCWW